MAFEIVDGMTGIKHISSDDLAALNTATVGKASCVLDYGNDFSLTMASANAATLGTGVGMVGGKRFWNQAPVQLTVESGAQGDRSATTSWWRAIPRRPRASRASSRWSSRARRPPAPRRTPQ